MQFNPFFNNLANIQIYRKYMNIYDFLKKKFSIYKFSFLFLYFLVNFFVKWYFQIFKSENKFKKYKIIVI